MISKLKNHILITSVLLLIGTPILAFATTQPEENKALTLAFKQFDAARKQLEKQTEKCEKQKSALKPSLFKSINLSKKEMEIALQAFNNKAEDNCEKSAKGKFIISTGIYRATAKHYNNPAKAAQPYTDDKMFAKNWENLELESQYLQLDKKQRKLLTKIRELKKPFRLTETLEKLSLN